MSERDAGDTMALRVTVQEEADPRRAAAGRRKRKGLYLAIVAVLLAGGTGAGLLWAGRGGNGSEPESGPKIKQIAVVRTDLSGTREMEGTLGYDSARTIRSAGEGRVTWLPTRGATVARGRQLYRVDERSAVVFYGSTPLYRRLDTPGTVGRDIRVVADNLKALGYDIGAQPAPGTVVRQEAPADAPPPATTGPGQEGTTPPAAPSSAPDGGAGQGTDASQEGAASPSPSQSTVREGDGVLTQSLMSAIERWQKAVGIEPTGVLDFSDVVVTKSAVRVSEVLAQPGDEASGDLMTVTATTKSVTVPVESLDIGSIKSGGRVTVVLPDQSTAAGRVAAISTTVQGEEDESGNTGQTKTNVTVSLDDPQAVKGIDSAPVQAQFQGESKKDVLAVPIGALLALREGGYAVRLSGGRLVPVDTGMFAKGLVEISGQGVSEGMKVETTA
ncbi:efflux RND transporter periplasmic adaptor subunit [Streptomyces sp. GESEQ-4]|uniref:efflux RND transporter periplasmic adaptor subunit n=1 Tax=Streptomyces sp. GESEQ-4 TaxID=2812655 RepID=UPI0027DD6EB2|nr:efflux RND transporter periplasmic adaptor subunit [Streptomyces sp. GESEQ-4]